MSRPRFHLSHSIVTTVILVCIELAFLHASARTAETLLLIVAAIGAIVIIFAATEAIEEVKGSRNLFVMLTLVLTQFVLYFAFEFWMLDVIQPTAFPTLGNGPTDYFLSSLMVFVLNPLYTPATTPGRILLIIETVGAIGLVLFVLQNMYQFRPKLLDKTK